MNFGLAAPLLPGPWKFAQVSSLNALCGLSLLGTAPTTFGRLTLRATDPILFARVAASLNTPLVEDSSEIR